jgi:DNA-binding transcriptional LysR family regulator
MNILHLRYIVEVEKTKSISKAAENLYMNQPNLSRAIKDLEQSMGIKVFKRNSKGITVTPEGEEFLIHAKKILNQIDEVKSLYQDKDKVKQKISISVPRVSYISSSFTDFTRQLNQKEEMDIIYRETNSMRAISNILQGENQLGIIRYQSSFDEYFQKYFKEKNLKTQLLTKFHYVALMSKDSELAKKGEFSQEELRDYIEIAHADPYVPSIPFLAVKKAEYTEEINKRIYVYERGSQMELLSTMTNTFMWVSPIPKHTLEVFNLTEISKTGNEKEYQDVLIYRKGHKITKLEQKFIDIVKEHARDIGICSDNQ